MAAEPGDFATIASVTATLHTIDPGQMTATGRTEGNPTVLNGAITAKGAARAAMVEMKVGCVIGAGGIEGGEIGLGLAAALRADAEAEIVIPTGDGVIVVAAAAVVVAVEVIVVGVAGAAALMANATTIRWVPLVKRRKMKLLAEKNTTRKHGAPMRRLETSHAKVGNAVTVEVVDGRRKRVRGGRHEAAVVAEADQRVLAVVRLTMMHQVDCVRSP